jgi:hypothetical protein
LIQQGPEYAADLLSGLSDWMARQGFPARGMLSVPAGADGAAYERAGDVKALQEAKQTYGIDRSI